MKNFFKSVFRPLKKALEKLFNVSIATKPIYKELTIDKNIPHSIISPRANYSPWINDDKFQSVFNIAREYSLVDEYRMYELYQLSAQASLLDGDFIEVGVWRGGSSAVIQSVLIDRNFSNNFYIADTWDGVVKAGSDYDTRYVGGEHSDADLSHVHNLYDSLELPKPEILVGIFPDDHPNVNIQRIAFLHSDVDAYQSTKDIIEWSLPKLVSGAIIVFDDYGFRGCEGVTKYVNDFFNKYSEKFTFLHNINGHAILIKK
jgi:O-methyltransferase